ncbi:VTT domain-containing protein [Bacillus cytotoxicus]|uniref:VTT domain-containing protein n=1 Tax=Bacillus cytotoxicus TaxID=580165 RepID=A0ACC6A8B6_9BACI|nr:VTT domain-containing protein [Bacillus cytotoxicus]
MELHELLSYIQHYGYVALFFCLWLGIVGMPIPAFLLTYLGVVSGLSLGYILGKTVGSKVLDALMKKKKAKYLWKSQALLDRYGHYALVVSYFIPVVRHIVPYLVGINNMSFRAYALYSYVTGFVWTLLYFMLGYMFGGNINHIVELTTKYGFVFGSILVVIFGVYYIGKEIKG